MRERRPGRGPLCRRARPRWLWRVLAFQWGRRGRLGARSLDLDHGLRMAEDVEMPAAFDAAPAARATLSGTWAQSAGRP